jgi:hypothetical protein
MGGALRKVAPRLSGPLSEKELCQRDLESLISSLFSTCSRSRRSSTPKFWLALLLRHISFRSRITASRTVRQTSRASCVRQSRLCSVNQFRLARSFLRRTLMFGDGGRLKVCSPSSSSIRCFFEGGACASTARMAAPKILNCSRSRSSSKRADGAALGVGANFGPLLKSRSAAALFSIGSLSASSSNM